MSAGASPLLLVARQELLLAARSRWVQIFAGVFALLALGVAGSGYVLSGGHGFQDFARTSASLVELVALVVPLAALLMGVLALAPERGTAELLYAQPVSRRTILLGELLGLFAALSAAELVGFGVAGVVVFSQAGEEGGGGYALLVLGAALLTAAFLAIAALIAAGAVGRRRVRALAVAVVVWFAAVVLLDVAALGVASLLPSGTASRLLVVAVIANPVGAVRTGSLLAVEGTAAFGAASLAFLRLTGGPAGAAAALASSLALWIVVPAALAARRIGRVDL
ncbi:ABC transporter permease [Anaeromyxobacter dehalogenans]|uniref:Putative membrane protein n=1 Tax=Anaeromyxobacter dehalogenans (strain 2CP-C) TaxID=290397 RepID=Q2IKI7_ANADE|nr:ABC transporter permease subunit [Anaeromyxobacter dehalogenans]ABC82167.1 putative membrane protein [Anaeromyxobacter dehalogenans 2CP-C]